MTQQQIIEWLRYKKALLEKLQNIVKVQMRFITRQEMRGLRRTIKESEIIIQELVDVDNKLKKEQNGNTQPQIQALRQSVAQEHRTVLVLSRQVLELARDEQKKIKDTLRQIRSGRIMQTGYVKAWLSVQGSRFNTKG